MGFFESTDVCNIISVTVVTLWSSKVLFSYINLNLMGLELGQGQ